MRALEHLRYSVEVLGTESCNSETSRGERHQEPNTPGLHNEDHRQRRIPPYPNKQGELQARTLGDYTAIPLAPTWNSWSNIYTANKQYRRYSKSRLHEIEQFCHDLNDKDNAWLGDEKGGHRQPAQHDTTNRHQLSHPKQKTELAKLLVENKHKLAGPKDSKECIVNWLSTIHENAQETPYYLRTGYRGDR